MALIIERVAGNPQVQMRRLAFDFQFHRSKAPGHAPSAAGSTNRLPQHTIQTGWTVAASFRDISRMAAMQGVSGAVPQPFLAPFGQQPGGSRVVLQERDILIHHKYRHGHRIEQHSVKALVQELYD